MLVLGLRKVTWTRLSAEGRASHTLQPCSVPSPSCSEAAIPVQDEHKSSLAELSRTCASSEDLSSTILPKTHAIAQGNLSSVPGMPRGLASCSPETPPTQRGRRDERTLMLLPHELVLNLATTSLRSLDGVRSPRCTCYSSPFPTWLQLLTTLLLPRPYNKSSCTSRAQSDRPSQDLLNKNNPFPPRKHFGPSCPLSQHLTSSWWLALACHGDIKFLQGPIFFPGLPQLLPCHGANGALLTELSGLKLTSC